MTRRSPRTPPHPLVRGAAGPGVRWTQAAIAWVGAISTALLFALLGHVVDRGASAAAVVGLVVLALVAASASGLGSWYAETAQARSEAILRRGVVARVLALDPYREREASGARLELATDAAARAAQYRAGFLGPILGALTAPLLVLGVMALAVDAVTAGVLAGLVLLVPVILGVFQRGVRGVGAAYGRSLARLTAAFLEAVRALETLVYARAAERIGSRLAADGERHRRAIMRMLAGNQTLILVLDAAFGLLVTVAATVTVVVRGEAGALTPGAGLAILGMTVLVIAPVDLVGQFFYIGIGGRAAVTRLSGFLGSGEPAPKTALPRVASGDGIRVDGVTVGWPGAVPVVAGLSLHVRPGERVALVGPSGSGKSTLLAALQGHLTPSAGTITVDGVDPATAPESARARIALVAQRHFLFDGSVADNLRLADASATEERMRAALDIAGLTAEVDAVGGLSAPIGENGARLSGGQAQRLAIARAALRDAPVLLLDEPTSQVGLAAEAEILAALDRLAAGRTVLMVAHRPGAILAADRVVSLGAEEAVR